MDCQFISIYCNFVTSQTASFSRADIKCQDESNNHKKLKHPAMSHSSRKAAKKFSLLGLVSLTPKIVKVYKRFLLEVYRIWSLI